MLNTEFVELVTEKLITFLKTTKVSPKIIDQYKSLTLLSPEQKIYFIREKIKPYKYDLVNEIDNQLKAYGQSVNDLDKNDVEKFVKYMNALIEVA